jgi:hypothetical protein
MLRPPRPSVLPGGRRPAARLAPVLLLAAALVLTACGEDEEDTATAAPTVSATTAPPEDPVEPEPGPEVTPDDSQVVAVTISGGQVTGVEPRTVVPLGSNVRLSITSDVADEVHVHGFELTERVSAGQAAQVEFIADRPGIFEIEMHDSSLLLTRLQVQ